MKRLLLCLALFLVPATAYAGLPTYTGNITVPSGANLTLSGVGNNLCLITNASSQVITAVCPTGTAAFVAGSNITITGSGPYTIACPNCFQTTGGTVSGATTFSAATTFSNTVTASKTVSFTASSGDASVAMQFNSFCPSSGYTSFRANNTVTVQAINGGAMYLACGSNGNLFTMDTTGDIGIAGTATATNFYSTSLRSHKQDIQPLSVDALQVLHDTDWATYRYRPQWGDPKQTHIGFIADDTPSILSGEKHDHFDAGSLATVDAQAILQLQTQLKVAVCTLGALIAVLLVGLVGVAFIRATD